MTWLYLGQHLKLGKEKLEKEKLEKVDTSMECSCFGEAKHGKVSGCFCRLYDTCRIVGTYLT